MLMFPSFFSATPMSPQTNTDQEFAYGAGQLNPLQAINPGLVYDAGEGDYINYLCAQGYNSTKLFLLSGENVICPVGANGTFTDLNYPSIAVPTQQGAGVNRTITRTVTNVGSPTSTYKASVAGQQGLTITVVPDVLSFKSLGETQTFTVTVTAAALSNAMSGSLVWDDGVYKVRSPIIAYVNDDSEA